LYAGIAETTGYKLIQANFVWGYVLYVSPKVITYRRDLNLTFDLES